MTEQVSARRSAGGPTSDEAPGGLWAVGLAIFAGCMMLMIGTFQAVEGVIAIIEDRFYVVTANYTFGFDVTVWGWIHVVLGALVAVAGVYVFSGSLWARIVGIGFVAANAISQFVFLPYYPVWAVIMIALDVAVIWALCVYGRGAADSL